MSEIRKNTGKAVGTSVVALLFISFLLAPRIGHAEGSKYCSYFGNLLVVDSYVTKNKEIAKELFEIEVKKGNWSEEYSKLEKYLKTRKEHYESRDQLRDELCAIKNTSSSEYNTTEMKISALDEILELPEQR